MYNLCHKLLVYVSINIYIQFHVTLDTGSYVLHIDKLLFINVCMDYRF